MPLETGFKNTLLRAITGKQSFTNSIYAALFIGKPGDGGAEVSAASYKRTAVCVYNVSGGNLMGEPTDGSVTNASTIYFPEATESWGTVTHVALYNAITGGTLIGHANIVDASGNATTLEITDGKVPLIRASKFTISFVDPT